MALVDHRETICPTCPMCGPAPTSGARQTQHSLGELQRSCDLGMGRWVGSDQSRQTPPREGIVTFGKLCNHLWPGHSQPEICSRSCTEQEHQPRTLEVFHGGYLVKQHLMLPRLLGQELRHKIRMANWCSENHEPLDLDLQRLVSTPNDSFWVFQPCSCQLVHHNGSPSAPVPHSFPTMFYLGQSNSGQFYLGQVYLGQVYLGQVYLGQVYLGQIFVFSDFGHFLGLCVVCCVLCVVCCVLCVVCCFAQTVKT